MHRATNFVAIQAVMVASSLPAEWGCAASPTISVFESEDDASGGERVYDPPPAWSGGAAMRIETGQQALSLALDSDDVYWQNPGGSLFACPLDGCQDAKPILISSLIGPGSGLLETLAAGDGVALFLTSGEAAISAFAGANPAHSPTTYLTGASGRFSAIVADAIQAYFVDYVSVDGGDGGGDVHPSLYSCALGAACSSPDSVYASRVASDALGPLFVADSEVYFVDSTDFGITVAIRAVPIHGGAVRTVCGSQLLAQVQAMTVAGAFAYFTTSAEPTSVYQCAASGGSDTAVYIQDLQPYALASDGANLYWTNYVDGPGSVVTCALGAVCQDPLTVASSQESPFAIAANSTSVYWSTASSIYRADK